MIGADEKSILATSENRVTALPEICIYPAFAAGEGTVLMPSGEYYIGLNFGCHRLKNRLLGLEV